MTSGAACERSSTNETPNTFSSGAAQSSSPDAAVTVIEDASLARAPTTTPAIDLSQRVVDGRACSPVGTRDVMYLPGGMASCECSITAGGVRWVCDTQHLTVEGPLPPPELAV